MELKSATPIDLSILPSARGMGASLTRQVGPEIDRSGHESGRRFGDGFLKSSIGPLRTFGEAAAGIFAVEKIGGFFKDSFKVAREQQVVAQETTAVIKSTGGAAHVTAGQVEELSKSLSNHTGISKLSIEAGARQLLTFTNIRNEVGKGNDIFNQATTAANNVSAALGIRMPAASRAVGRALNDPVKGLSILTRYGIQFSDATRKQIASLVAHGKTLEAQKIILGSFQTKFGGAAAASTTAGQKLSVAFENFKESVGSALIPVVDRLEGVLVNDVIPALSKFGGWIRRNQAWLKPLGAVLAGAAVGLVAFKLAVEGVTLATRAWAVIQLILNGEMDANPIGIVIVAIAALAGGIIYAYKHSARFRSIVHGAFSAVGKIISATMHAGVAVIHAFVASFDAVKHAVSAVISFVQGHWKLIIGALGGPIGIAVALVITHFSQIRSAVSHVIGAVIGFFKSLPGRIVSAVGDLGSLLYNAGKAAIDGLVHGILDTAKGALTGALHFVTHLIPIHKGPIEKDRRLLRPAGEAIIHGLIAGIQSGTAALTDTLHTLTRSISQSGASDTFKNHWNDALTSVGKSLTALTTKFKAVQSAQKQMASNLISGADPSNANTATVAGLIGFDRQQDTGIVAFRRNLALMRKHGFRPGYVAKLAGEGLDAAPLVANLAHATASQVRTIDRLNHSIRANATALADSTYSPQLGDIAGELRALRQDVRGDGKRLVDAERGIKRHQAAKSRTKTGRHKP